MVRYTRVGQKNVNHPHVMGNQNDYIIVQVCKIFKWYIFLDMEAPSKRTARVCECVCLSCK